MKLAIDLEEVLADTIGEACRSSENLSESDFSEWDLSSYTWQVYAGVSDALWRHDPLSIPPTEPNLNYHVGNLYESTDTLDIVTARMHVDERIEDWLENHNVPYDSIVSTQTPKYELDYDAYIDDNPSMVGECRLFLRTHPHNNAVDTTAHKGCTRIDSLADVSEFL